MSIDEYSTLGGIPVEIIENLMKDEDAKMHLLLPPLYEPMVPGKISDLIDRVESLQEEYPLFVEVFLNILHANKKISCLEDWLVVVPFQFAWTNNKKDIHALEDIFNEVATSSPDAWKSWVGQIVQESSTANDVLNRFYTDLLHLYAVCYLIRQEFEDIVFPLKIKGKKNTDIVATKDGERFVVECKFIGTSKKLESFCWRFCSALRIINIKTAPWITYPEFSSSNCIKSLSSEHCLAVKYFIRKVASNPYFRHSGHFEDFSCEYSPLFPIATTIESQKKFANHQAKIFLKNCFERKLNEAAEQLGCVQYNGYKKILFIGIQIDYLFLIDWTSQEVKYIKEEFAAKAKEEHTIKVIFSEDVGFSFYRYL